MKKIEEVEFEGWKHCVRLTNDDVEMVITLDMGPRIISLTKAGGKNHMTVFAETKGKVIHSENFVPYGGHRVWHAPEQKGRTDLGDNVKVSCEIDREIGAVTVMGAVEAGTRLQRGFTVFMKEEGKFLVTHRIENKGLFPVEFSVWGLSQFAVGGMLALPNSTRDTGLVSNRAISLWPYAKMTDSRVRWGDRFICVTPDTAHETPFKFGATCDAGYAAYFNFGQLIVKKFDYSPKEEYPNYKCNFESYTNSQFIEIETLSPLSMTDPGVMQLSSEEWCVFDGVDRPAAGDDAAILAALRSVGVEK